MGESDRGTVLFEQACADARRLGHANAYLLNLGGIIFMRAADFERADRYFQEAAEVLRGRHQPHSWVLAINRGWLSWLQGDDSAAGEVARELYTLLEGKGVPWRTDALSLNFLARACTAEGRLAEAVDLLVTSLSLSAEKRQEWFSALSLEGLARILGNRSRGLEGATLMGAAASMRERAGTPFSPGEAKRSVEETDHTRDECSPDLWAAAFAAGQSLAFDDAVQLALSSFPPAPDHLLYPFPTS